MPITMNEVQEVLLNNGYALDISFTDTHLDIVVKKDNGSIKISVARPENPDNKIKWENIK